MEPNTKPEEMKPNEKLQSFFHQWLEIENSAATELEKYAAWRLLFEKCKRAMALYEPEALIEGLEVLSKRPKGSVVYQKHGLSLIVQLRPHMEKSAELEQLDELINLERDAMAIRNAELIKEAIAYREKLMAELTALEQEIEHLHLNNYACELLEERSRLIESLRVKHPNFSAFYRD